MPTPPSQQARHIEPMLDQGPSIRTRANIGPTLGRCVLFAGLDSDKPTNRAPDAGLMLVQRRRRWTNIEPALGQGVVFAGS